MYRPTHYAEDRIEVLHRFIQDYPLATLISQGPRGLLANLVPVSLHPEGPKGTIRLHLAKANMQVQELEQSPETLIVFTGPSAYVTPNWYPTKKAHGKAVPTYNYAMVQVRGKAIVKPQAEWLLKQVTDLTNKAEAASEHPWKVTDAPPDYIQAQLKAIVGIEIQIESLEGKFKVSQNQPEVNRASVEAGFREMGHEAMAELVKNKGIK